LELGTGAWRQKLKRWGYRAEKKDVRRYLQPSGCNTRTWRTDRQTDRRILADSKDRAYP